MKKLFFFIPALLLSLLVNAKTWNIAPGTSLAYTVNDADSGDVIVMADGLYPGEDQIKFVKDITIKAAEGATPVVQTTYYCELKSGAKVFIEGITFDGSTTSQQFVRTYDATAGKEIHLNKCEFKNYPKDVISGDKAEYTLDSCVVTNCYFHDNTYSPIYFNKSSVEGQQTIYGLIVKNSTFANNDPSKEYRSVIDVQSYDRAATDDIEVLVDHCTFYNNTVINSDYSAIRTRIVNNTTVSNSIFAHPTAVDLYATTTWAGTVTNCLAYNFNSGYRSGPTRTNTNTGDPLFADAANGDFSLAGNWVTMALSPARGAATDGSDLGDPRWYTAETLPSTDFASPYAFVGEKAIVSNSMELDANNYIHSKSSGGSAIWKIHSTRACDVEVTLNMDPDGNVIGHNYQVEIFDADGNSIGTLDEGGWQSNVDDKVLSGKFHFPAEGDYKIELTNSISGTTSTIKGITLTFAGGAVFDIPTTLLPVDATISQYAEINGDEELVFSTKDWLVTEQYGKWNIHVEKGGDYAFQLNAKSTNSHSYKVSILTANESETLQYFEKAGSSGNDLSATEVLTLAPGDYVVMVQNTTNYSAGRLVNIIITYKGGARITLPATCDFADLILSEKAHITAGELWFNTIGDSNPVGQWAKWNVKVAEAGTFLFTMNVSSTNGQSYKISILDGETEIDAFESGSVGTGDKTVKHYFNLAAGNYTVKLENTYAWSQGHIVSLDVTQPSLLVIDEAATSNTVIHNNYRNGNHDIQIIRAITAGMYNTICLPFDVSSSALSEMFGNNVELLEMESATIDGIVLDLNFANATSIYRGTPYLIKTTKTVTNPVFTDVEIKAEEGDATDGDAANFIGTFIKTTIPESPNNLFLGASNKLYFPEGGDMPIKGMRAYFVVDGSSTTPVRQARIVAQGNVVTELELISNTLPESNNKIQRRIENGQLTIILNGVQYNALGVRVK